MKTIGFIVVLCVVVAGILWHSDIIEVSGSVELTDEAINIYNESLDVTVDGIKSIKKDSM